MTSTVQKLAEQIKSLPDSEFDELLSWLTEYELEHADEWDEQIRTDTQPGGQLESMVERTHKDIMAGKIKPLDEVIDNS